MGKLIKKVDQNTNLKYIYINRIHIVSDIETRCSSYGLRKAPVCSVEPHTTKRLKRMELKKPKDVVSGLLGVPIELQHEKVTEQQWMENISHPQLEQAQFVLMEQLLVPTYLIIFVGTFNRNKS